MMSRHAAVSNIKSMTTKYSNPARSLQQLKCALMHCLQRYVYAFPRIYTFYKICLKYQESDSLSLTDAMSGIIRKPLAPVYRNLQYGNLA